MTVETRSPEQLALDIVHSLDVAESWFIREYDKEIICGRTNQYKTLTVTIRDEDIIKHKTNDEKIVDTIAEFLKVTVDNSKSIEIDLSEVIKIGDVLKEISDEAVKLFDETMKAEKQAEKDKGETQAMKINMQDKYKTRSGEDATILLIDGKGHHPVVGYVNGSLMQWTSEGTIHIDSDVIRNHAYDLVKVDTLDDLEIDDIVLVKFYGFESYQPRHYAGNGEFFSDGRSSKTNKIGDIENSTLKLVHSEEWKLPETQV